MVHLPDLQSYIVRHTWTASAIKKLFDEQKTCPMCLDNIQKLSKVCHQCGENFHPECVDTFFKEGDTEFDIEFLEDSAWMWLPCPVCRFERWARRPIDLDKFMEMTH